MILDDLLISRNVQIELRSENFFELHVIFNPSKIMFLIFSFINIEFGNKFGMTLPNFSTKSSDIVINCENYSIIFIMVLYYYDIILLLFFLSFFLVNKKYYLLQAFL